MVYLGVGEDRGRVSESKSMAMGPERSKPLHNFNLPCLKWGNQRYLRCMKVSSGSDGGGVGADVSTSGGRRPPVTRLENLTATRKRELELEGEKNARDSEKRMKVNLKSRVEDGIEAVREKLMFDLKTETNKMKDAYLGKEAAEDDGKDEEEQESLPPPPAEARPWNLRTRRAAFKAPVGGGSEKGLKIEEKKPNSSPFRTENGVNSPRLKGVSEKKERVKFSVSLSRKEVEEDFMEMLGHRLPRRPKKRARIVQKQLDCLFPGLWLTEVTADSYKVPEAPDNGKIASERVQSIERYFPLLRPIINEKGSIEIGGKSGQSLKLSIC